LQKIKEITIYTEGVYVSAWLTARCRNDIIRAASRVFGGIDGKQESSGFICGLLDHGKSALFQLRHTRR